MSDIDLPGLTEFAFDRLLRPLAASGGGGARISVMPAEAGRGGLLVVSLAGEGEGEVAACLDGLVSISASAQIRRLTPRSRGARVEGGLSRLVGVRGEGCAVISPQGHVFEVFRLRRDLCYLRESMVWALEGGLEVDVGLLPGSRQAGLDGVPMLRLAGDGSVAVRTPGAVIAVPVRPESPQRVAGDAIVGWIGGIGGVTALAEPAEGLVRCEGEGTVLVAVGPWRAPGGGAA